MDALPDFLDKFHFLVPLVHELFLVVREIVEGKQNQSILDISKILNLHDENDEKQNAVVQELLYKKLRDVFQEYNKNIFSFKDKDADAK